VMELFVCVCVCVCVHLASRVGVAQSAADLLPVCSVYV